MPKILDALTAADRRRLTGPALRAFWNLARLWELTDDEQMKLLDITSRSTLVRWRSGRVVMLRVETLERLSLLFGVFRALNELFGPGDMADHWVRKPNRAPLFRGGSALDLMLSGRIEDLRDVRRYLDAVL